MNVLLIANLLQLLKIKFALMVETCELSCWNHIDNAYCVVKTMESEGHLRRFKCANPRAFILATAIFTNQSLLSIYFYGVKLLDYGLIV